MKKPVKNYILIGLAVSIFGLISCNRDSGPSTNTPLTQSATQENEPSGTSKYAIYTLNLRKADQTETGLADLIEQHKRDHRESSENSDEERQGLTLELGDSLVFVPDNPQAKKAQTIEVLSECILGDVNSSNNKGKLFTKQTIFPFMEVLPLLPFMSERLVFMPRRGQLPSCRFTITLLNEEGYAQYHHVLILHVALNNIESSLHIKERNTFFRSNFDQPHVISFESIMNYLVFWDNNVDLTRFRLQCEYFYIDTPVRGTYLNMAEFNFDQPNYFFDSPLYDYAQKTDWRPHPHSLTTQPWCRLLGYSEVGLVSVSDYFRMSLQEQRVSIQLTRPPFLGGSYINHTGRDSSTGGREDYPSLTSGEATYSPSDTRDQVQKPTRRVFDLKIRNPFEFEVQIEFDIRNISYLWALIIDRTRVRSDVGFRTAITAPLPYDIYAVRGGEWIHSRSGGHYILRLPAKAEFHLRGSSTFFLNCPIQEWGFYLRATAPNEYTLAEPPSSPIHFNISIPIQRESEISYEQVDNYSIPRGQSTWYYRQAGKLSRPGQESDIYYDEFPYGLEISRHVDDTFFLNQAINHINHPNISLRPSCPLL